MREFPSDLLRSRLRGPVLAAAGVVLALASTAGAVAQERQVVSHEVAVARGEASLHVEFDGDRSLDISLSDGVIRIGDEEIGRYEPGSDLETAWRDLLGRAVVLADGPLARALRDWEPPSGLAGASADAARRIDQALEDAMAAPSARNAPEAEAAARSSAIVGSLLGRSDRLVELAAALDGVDLEGIDLRIGDDVEVGEDERIVGSLIVVDADLDVRGEVRGDVVVVGGTLRTFEGSLITGDVRLADARLVREGGTIEGDWTEAEEDVREVRDRIREELRRELRDEIRSDLRRELRAERDDDGWSLFAPFHSFGQGLAALFGDLMKTFIMALIGGAVLFFARRNVEVVAESARRAPGRAAVVGLAGSFLVLPVYVLGAIALAISIIGLPVLLAWIPLFPVAVAVAAGIGFYAVAANVGDWLARRRYPGTDWIRTSNIYTLVVGGVIALMIPFLAADVVRMAGSWMAFLHGLLTAIGALAGIAVTMVGFGAVLLTRAGRRPEYYRGRDFFDDDWDFDGPSTPSSPTPPGPDEGPGGESDWFGEGTGASDQSTGTASAGTGARDRGASDTARAGTGARRTPPIDDAQDAEARPDGEGPDEDPGDESPEAESADGDDEPRG